MSKKQNKFFQVITQKQTYLNTLYLFLLFPLGTATFVLVITFLSIALGFISSPFLHFLGQFGIVDANLSLPQGFANISPDILVILVGFAGIPLLFASLHLFNLLVSFMKFINRALIGEKK